ncbi:heme-binding domain-containing protein [Olivibacter sp. CPCC 100613]|uniref:heme-binding domain-containing protein n=1 Tax=Olivibacter sp. CPCC 100613 TaxID=3079931 RepID=UPI002FFC6CE5
MNRNNMMIKLKKPALKKMMLLSVCGAFVYFTGVIMSPQQPIGPVAITETTDGQAALTKIFKRACFDCHSNETKFQWYDRLPILSWKIKKDVQRAREVMNFSDWEHLSTAEKEGKLWAILNMMKARKMPLKPYALTHPNARITAADITTVERYVRSLADHQIVSDTMRQQAANAAFDTWKKKQLSLQNLPISPNGIPYSDAFKNWKVII